MINNPDVSVQKEIFPFLNIALYLNQIPLIHKLAVANNSNTDTPPLTLKITSDLPCIEPFSYSFESVPAGRDIKIPLHNLKINRSYVSNISETETANITIELACNGQPVAVEEQRIEIHPLEQFGGFHILPELIAAYVTPNHPYVYHIKRRAVDIMEQNGHRTAFEGYQGSMDWHENASSIIENIAGKVKQLQLQPCMEEDQPVAFEPLKAGPLAEAQPAITNKQRPYIAHALTPVPQANSEAMYDFQTRNRIKQQIQMLTDAEEPISKAWLYKKLLQAWNTSRAGARLDKHIEEIIREMPLKQTMHQQPFYWRAQTDTASLNHYRSNDTEKRAIEDIAPEEIMVALQEAVQHNLSIEEEELLRYLSRTFGFAKVGRQIDALLRYAIDMAEREGKVRREGGRVKIV